jgi:hypothetical protein
MSHSIGYQQAEMLENSLTYLANNNARYEITFDDASLFIWTIISHEST